MLSKLELQQAIVAIIIGFLVAPVAVLLKLMIPAFFGMITHYPRMLSDVLGPFWLLIPLSIGGLATGFLVYKLAEETAGGGLDNAISTYHDQNGRFRHRAAPLKFLTTIFTVGSGGSGGIVGPTGFIGGGIGQSRTFMLLLKTAHIGEVSATVWPKVLKDMCQKKNIHVIE